MSEAILVVGGYGTIGRTVCTEVVDRISKPVIAAGRSRDAAERFAAGVDDLDARSVDVTDAATYDDALVDVGTVVMCLDQDDPSFARTCFERGIDYVDVSPTDRLLKRLESFEETATERGATGVLSVGLSPGMTNLFVADALDILETVERVDCTLFLGLGEAFGPNTVEWTLENGLTSFSVREGGRTVRVDGFSDPREVEIPGWGRRRAYRANLADQHVLARTTDVPTIATRLCYDSRLMTTYVRVLKRMGLYRTLVSGIGVRRLARLIGRVSVGAEESVVLIEVRGSNGDQHRRLRWWVRGRDQARATSLVAATVTDRLLSSSFPAGVYHIQQLFELAPFAERLVDAGYTLGRTEAGHSQPRRTP